MTWNKLEITFLIAQKAQKIDWRIQCTYISAPNRGQKKNMMHSLPNKRVVDKTNRLFSKKRAPVRYYRSRTEYIYAGASFSNTQNFWFASRDGYKI